MSWTWVNPPAVVVISGSHDFLRIRELKKAISAADANHREVLFIGGADRDGLSDVLSSAGVFFKDKSLVIVTDPEKVDTELVWNHHERGDNTTVVLIHHEGAIKATGALGKLVKKLPPKSVATFASPTPWEEVEKAAEFLVAEATHRKLKLDLRLAAGMVQNIGTDYGILAFEIDKIAMLISAEGCGPEVSSDQVKSVIAGFSELGAMPIVESLGRKDLRGVARALSNMRRTHGGPTSGATLRACALLTHNITTWLHTASLLGQGSSTDEIAERIKLPPFVVRKNILPVARQWSETSLVALLNSMATVERSVKSGHIHPWVELECALFCALGAPSHG